MGDEGDLILILLAMVAAIVLIGSLFALMPGYWGMMGPMGMMGGMMGGWGFAPGWGLALLNILLFLVLIGIVFFGAYYLITALRGEAKLPRLGEDRALAILRERYAKGEITKEQFLEMKEELTRR